MKRLAGADDDARGGERTDADGTAGGGRTGAGPVGPRLGR